MKGRVSKIVWIKAKYLRLDPETQRAEGAYDPKTFDAMVENMKDKGYREEHPLVITPDPEKGKGHYVIPCGHTRFKAGLKAKIEPLEFPCIVKKYKDKIEKLVEAHWDNKLSFRPDAITEAKLYAEAGREILEKRTKIGHTPLKRVNALERKYPVKQIAFRFKEDEDYVSHRLKLLRLPEFVRWMVVRYNQPSQRGHKLSPTIAEDLVRIQDLLYMRKRAGTEDKNFKIEKAIKDLAVMFWKEHVNSHDARKLAADIAYRGYVTAVERFKEKKAGEKAIPTELMKTLRCAYPDCGVKVDSEDFPWLPFCAEHKRTVLTLPLNRVNTNSIVKEAPLNRVTAVKRKSPDFNPENRPLHELDPEVHRPKSEIAMKKYLHFKPLAEKVWTDNGLPIPSKFQNQLDKWYEEWQGKPS